MPTTLEEMMAELPEDRRAAIEARVAERVREYQAGLRELRQAAGKTQQEVAVAMHCKQPAIAKMEGQLDFYLSTLRKYVEAVGGSLELVVNLPGKGEFHLTGVGEITSSNGSESMPA